MISEDLNPPARVYMHEAISRLDATQGVEVRGVGHANKIAQLHDDQTFWHLQGLHINTQLPKRAHHHRMLPPDVTEDNRECSRP